ncbi:M61 family peptidase [Acidithiobacillus sp. AMEEHan]|uniref:M61 family metallopeptidase n=1 Tax=Acidithiobacillus sp. AMEEHan TaxID=2994951 RepID=UPI0027E51B59|nr:M61 family peptidase [Acidithiobacillus sp. AMEEHan]
MNLQYHIRLHASAHLIQVDLHLAEPDPDGQILALPAWVPGSYTVRDLARHIVSMRATAGGLELPVEKFRKDHWRLAPGNGPVTISYQVYAFDRSVRTAYLDDMGGFFNGPAVFLRVLGQEQREHILRISGPADWQLATSMQALSASAWSWGEFQAADYRSFCNHPLLFGPLHRVDFCAGELPHHLALLGHDNPELLRVGEDLARICAYQQQFWRGSPFSRYHFLCMGGQNVYGGLEHQASSALLCSRSDLDGTDPKGYRQFLGLASHEYFHSWLVQGIRPAAWSDSFWETEIISRDLWVFEGITSYYDSLLLCRAGLWSPGEYLEELGQEITRLARRPGEAYQSLAESSADAWTKLYHPHPSAANFEISYYNKGALAALCLDARLRQRGSSLDAFLRQLWQEYGQTQRSLPEGEIFSLLETVLGNSVGNEVRQWVIEAQPLPLEECLQILGIDLHWRAARDEQDRGGQETEGRRSDLGAHWKKAALGVELTFVRAGAAAEQAGLCPGDRLLALDGEEILAERLQTEFDRLPPGIPRHLHFLRDGRMRECDCLPLAPPLDTAYLQISDGGNQRCSEWLSGTLANQPAA